MLKSPSRLALSDDIMSCVCLYVRQHVLRRGCAYVDAAPKVFHLSIGRAFYLLCSGGCLQIIKSAYSYLVKTRFGHQIGTSWGRFWLCALLCAHGHAFCAHRGRGPWNTWNSRSSLCPTFLEFWSAQGCP